MFRQRLFSQMLLGITLILVSACGSQGFKKGTKTHEDYGATKFDESDKAQKSFQTANYHYHYHHESFRNDK